jgi:hypothetical protein
MARGVPKRVTERSEAPLVRVVVYVDQGALEDLELLVRYRFGPRSRSAVVREAIGWLRAKEASWLLEARRRARVDRERADREAVEASRPREERERLEAEEAVASALAMARSDS